MKNILIFSISLVLAVGLNAQSTLNVEENKITRHNVLQFHGLFGSSKIGLGVKYKSIYEIKPQMHVGWGLGLDSYDSGLKRNFLPISVELIGDLFREGLTPFYMLSAGYGVSLGEDDDFAEESRGGIMADFSIGIRSKKHVSQPYLSIGYRMQHAFYAGEDDYGNIDKDVVYKRWNVSAGMLF